jgi:uncharacterized protein (TIGR02266 family)
VSRASALRQQRRYRRLTVRLHVSWLVEDDGRVGAAIATTLGAGGLFIATEAPLAAGTQLRVRLRLPGDDDSHELAGRVVWANSASTPGVPPSGRGMGISFTDRNAQARLAVDLERYAASTDA